MKTIIKFLLLPIVCVLTGAAMFINRNRVEELREHLINNNSGHVMVVAHRGDWRNFPENSLEAIRSCIDMGVDMVEIDVTLTKDSIPVLLHDSKLDRSTTGKGKVAGYTFEQLKKFRLRDGLGRRTDIAIPTLEEAMRVAKGKILVNLDKSEDILPLVYGILKKTGTVDHVVVGSYDSYQEMRRKAGAYLDSILFMPKIREKTGDISGFLREYYSHLPIEVVQFGFDNEQSAVLAYADSVARWGSRAWINTITADRCGNHHDDRALADPDGSYGWAVRNGFTMLQTDRIQLLTRYLENINKRLADH